MFILSENDTILALELNRHLDKKAMKKYLLKIQKWVHPRAARGVVARMLQSKDYIATLDQIMREMDEVQATATAFYADGKTGMVMVDNEIYPVEVHILDEIPEDDGFNWSVEHEDEVSYVIAQRLTDLVKTNSPRCTVILFKAAGYSGKPKDWAIEYGKRGVTGLLRRAS